jgi:Na+-transporting NADH:ubiquinone oxidoreductase subunit F
MVLSVLTAVVVVSSIGAGLAALLVVCEHFFANYGPCSITINNEREFTVDGSGNLLSTLTAEKIFIPSACGGRGTCGLCKLKVLEGAGPLLPTEEPYLEKDERASNVRLGCQVKIRADLKVEIPQEFLAVREYVCKCTDIADLTHDMKQFRLEFVEPETIDYVPGQYIQLLTPVYKKSSEEVYRAYSISSDPAEKNVIELIIRLVPGGICTTYCFEYLKVGDEVKINGPHGDFRLSDTDAPIVFVAGGSGMAPIKCMLHEMKNTGNKRRTMYLFGANKVKELCLGNLMSQFESELADFKFVPVVAAPEEGQDWDGEKGLVTEAVQRNVDNADRCEASENRMKESPQDKKLEEVLRSSKLAAGGFMGRDTRSVSEIVDADAAALSRLGFTREQIAARMRHITGVAKAGLGTWVRIDETLEAKVDEARGRLVCPWPHPGTFLKRITSLKVIETGASTRWSDLNIHLIGEHGFFEGKGSDFRIEPTELVRVIF